MNTASAHDKHEFGRSAWPKCSIRSVTHRPDGFVTFELTAGDPDLFVEMLLSSEAFREFSVSNGFAHAPDARTDSAGAFPDVRLRDVALRPEPKNQTN